MYKLFIYLFFFKCKWRSLKLECFLCTIKEEATATPSRSRGKCSSKESAVTKEQDKKGRESQRSRRRSQIRVSSMSDCTEPTQDPHQAALELKRSQRQGKRHRHIQQRHIVGVQGFFVAVVLLTVCVGLFSLTTFRWVVPANGEVVLRIWFYSDSPGKFEQTFNFELLGTQRHYQLQCIGLSTYPSICKDYKSVSIV